MDTSLSIPGSETSAGWVKFKANPVLGAALGTCFDLSLLRDEQGFHMWFSWRPKKSIAYTHSLDGIQWTDPLIVLGPNEATTWEKDINRPSVVKRANSYHMWYTGQVHGPNRTGNSWIGHAISADGKSWRRTNDQPVLSPESAWEKVAVMCPNVLWDAEARLYQMWYSGGEQYEPNALGYATSADGLNWSKHAANPVFASDRRCPWEQHKVAGGQIIRHGDWYLLFYIGYRDEDHAQIGLARSRDGLTNWQRHPANPIIRPGENAWDHDATYKPFAVLEGSRWLLWYNGRHGDVEQIGLVSHEGEDLGFDK